jgi:preprotein translocase subunit YajC
MEGIGSFLPLILIFGVFYLLLIRPQQKKARLHREMLSNIKRGDKIVTSGGIIALVNKVNDNRELIIEIANDVEIKIAPGMIADLYISPETIKKVIAPVKENKGGFLSRIIGNKK